MNGYKVAALIIIALNALLFVGKVGKPRKPVSPSEAMSGLIEWGILAWLLVVA